MQSQPEQYTARVITGREAQRVAATLSVSSIWFQMEPLPFDAYEFTVKSEHSGALDVARTVEPPYKRLVMSGNEALVLMRKAIVRHIELEEESANPIDDAVLAALRWYEECAYPPIAPATDSPHAVTLTEGENQETVYINIARGGNGWYYTNALCGTDGIFGVQCEDVGPHESEADALYPALIQAAEYAAENDYLTLSLTEHLSQIQDRSYDLWEQVEAGGNLFCRK